MRRVTWTLAAPDAARQRPQDAGVGHQPHLRERRMKRCILRGHDDVACRHQRQASTCRNPLDRDDHWFGPGCDQSDYVLKRKRVAQRPQEIGTIINLRRLHISSRAEMTVGTGQYDRSTGVGPRRFSQPKTKFPAHFRRQRVALSRLTQREYRDRSLLADLDRSHASGSPHGCRSPRQAES